LSIDNNTSKTGKIKRQYPYNESLIDTEFRELLYISTKPIETSTLNGLGYETNY
jgi:hypothetical protein